MILSERALILDLALNGRLPMIGGFTSLAKAGDLMADGANLPSMLALGQLYRSNLRGRVPIERPRVGARSSDMPTPSSNVRVRRQSGKHISY